MTSNIYRYQPRPGCPFESEGHAADTSICLLRTVEPDIPVGGVRDSAVNSVLRNGLTISASLNDQHFDELPRSGNDDQALVYHQVLWSQQHQLVDVSTCGEHRLPCIPNPNDPEVTVRDGQNHVGR